MQANGVLIAVFAAPEAAVASAADVYGAHCLTEVAGDVEAVVAVWCFAWDTVIGGVGVCQCQRTDFPGKPCMELGRLWFTQLRS